MSKFENLTDEEVKEIAETYSVEESEVYSLPVQEVLLDFPQLEEKLAEEEEEKKPAKKAAAKKTTAKKAASSKTVVPDDKVLVKMTRNNPIYEVRGYRFERDRAPFVFVDKADVDYLIEVEGGFTIARPDEVESFYN